MFWLKKDEELVKDYVAGISGNIRDRIECEQKKKRLNKVCRDILDELLNEDSDFFYEKILEIKPDKMMKFYAAWSNRFKCTRNGVSIYGEPDHPQLSPKSAVSKMLKRIFNYNEFSKKTCTWEWNAYKFAEKLDVTVCPYCGRQFIGTVIVRKHMLKSKQDLQIIRAELDHYIPKSKFPMFALSFYNLIPSCHFCNSSIKSTKELSVKEHIHPYIESNADFKFVYKLTEKEIFLDYINDIDDKVKKTCDFFYIKDIYQLHKGIAGRYYEEAREFSKSLLNEYQDFLQKNANPNISKKEIFFHKFRISEDTEEEILGKFRHDIVEGIIEKYGSQ